MVVAAHAPSGGGPLIPWPWQNREQSGEPRPPSDAPSPGGREPHDTLPRWGEVGIHGIARPRQWDAVAVAEAPGLPGDAVAFFALPDRSLLCDDDLPEGALAPLAQALETSLEPPYRAEAVRRGPGPTWAVGGRAIEVVELPDVSGSELTISVQGDARTFAVDGEEAFGGVPELERLASRRFDDYVLHAERLDGALWRFELSPL